MARFFAMLGAAAYFAWGVLHLLAATSAYMLARHLDAGLVQGRLFQNAFYVAAFALVAIIVALGLNWRNSRLGYWLNLLTVSVADIPFVLFIVLPGHMTGVESLLGPSLWLAGATLSTMALLSDRATKVDL
jgi:hypothetical protein